MKLQTTAPAPPATAEALAEQALSEAASVQANGQIAARDALREALPSRNAGEGSSRTARRSGASILRSIASTSTGASAHASQRMQAVRQSEDVQIQDDGTEESIDLPQQLDSAIADWASEVIDQATLRAGGDTETLTRPSHQRVTRDGRRQQPRGRQHPSHEQAQEQSQEQAQEQGRQEAPAAGESSAPTAQAFADGATDQALAGDPTQSPETTSESPWNPHPRARSTARIAPLAATAPAQRQVDELDARLAASKSNSDVTAALLWGLAAMVTVIVSMLLLAFFSNDTNDAAPEPAEAHPIHHDTPPDMQKSHEAEPSDGHPMNGRAPNV